MSTKTASRAATYETDFHEWTAAQARALRGHRTAGLDWENLAEEIESLGHSEESEIESRMNVLLAHLLKWEFQPAGRGNSWRATIDEQRYRIARVIKRSPSLKHYPSAMIAEEYPNARLHASGETGLAESTFPVTCPYPIGHILDPDFFPGTR